MNKIIVLTTILSLSVFAADEEGTGGTPSNSSTTTVYQLICSAETIDVGTNNNQVKPENCTIVAVTSTES